MEEDGKKNVVNNFEAGSNCQVFNGNISGCVFAMPGAMVTQQAAPPQPNDSGLKEAGLVDADGQPTVSRTEAALLANMLARRLGITNKWKVFERLWHRNNMRGDYNSALEQRKSLEIQERLKNILD